jgi:hypothetical protein
MAKGAGESIDRPRWEQSLSPIDRDITDTPKRPGSLACQTQKGLGPASRPVVSFGRCTRSGVDRSLPILRSYAGSEWRRR